MKVYSCWNPPKVKGEKSDLPSITDKLAAEDLSVTVERFLRSPYLPGHATYEYEGDEQGAIEALDEGVNVDVEYLDKVDCLNILADAERLAEQLRVYSKQATAKKDVTKTDKPKVVQDIADEPKDEK